MLLWGLVGIAAGVGGAIHSKLDPQLRTVPVAMYQHCQQNLSLSSAVVGREAGAPEPGSSQQTDIPRTPKHLDKGRFPQSWPGSLYDVEAILGC